MSLILILVIAALFSTSAASKYNAGTEQCHAPGCKTFAPDSVSAKGRKSLRSRNQVLRRVAAAFRASYHANVMTQQDYLCNFYVFISVAAKS